MKGWKELIQEQYLHLNTKEEHLNPQKKEVQKTGITMLQEKTQMLIIETLCQI